MHLAIIILSLIFTGAAQAVVTKKCPQNMNITVPKIQKFSKSFIDKIIADKDFDEEYGESYDSESIRFFLERDEISNGFSFNFELESKKDSNCYYSYNEVWGGVMSAKITGTDAKPLLTIVFSNEEEAYEDEQVYREVLMFADVTSKSPTYNFSGAELQIKASGTQSSWGATYVSYIPVGKAQIIDDPQFKYQVTPESWSIDLLLDTCKRKLESAIQSALKDLGEDAKDSVYLLPRTIGYKYFKVTFKAKDGSFVLPSDTFEYEFEYKTQDDAYTKCIEVMPHDLVY